MALSIDTILTPVNLNPLQPADMNPFGIPRHNLTTEDVNENPFSAFFGAAMDMARASNEHQLYAERLQLDFATGRTDDILAVQLAQDRAATSLNFTVQVTNRIIESYREIMRMQI
jgi:flagellar hook-basal body complex protein FliE